MFLELRAKVIGSEKTETESEKNIALRLVISKYFRIYVDYANRVIVVEFDIRFIGGLISDQLAVRKAQLALDKAGGMASRGKAHKHGHSCPYHLQSFPVYLSATPDILDFILPLKVLL